MFYLKTFFSVLFKAYVRGFLFLLLSFLLVFTLSHKSQLEPYLGKWNSSPEEGAYFYALISNKENLSEIRSKIGMLPGVSAITELSSQQIANEVRALLGGSDVTPQMLSFDYQGVKVNFEVGLKTESQALIREFLTRLCSEGNLLMGATREVASSPRALSGWDKWLFNFWSFWVFLTLVWSVLFISLLPPLRAYSYLVEKFQRRKKVAFKSAFFGTFFLILIAMLLSLIWWPVDLVLLPALLLFPFASFFSGFRKFIWSA